jgi:hypothetical protein
MLKKALDVSKALNSQPDYSVAFTRRVGALARRIHDDLSVPVEHDSDMNYSSAQKIVVWLDKSCRPVSPMSGEAIFRLYDYISSRADYFTFVTLRLSASERGWKERGLAKPARYWIAVAQSDAPAGVKAIKDRLSSIMQSEGYTLVHGTVLSEEVKGRLTELDKKPATVFEVLFSEL